MIKGFDFQGIELEVFAKAYNLHIYNKISDRVIYYAHLAGKGNWLRHVDPEDVLPIGYYEFGWRNVKRVILKPKVTISFHGSLE